MRKFRKLSTWEIKNFVPKFRGTNTSLSPPLPPTTIDSLFVRLRARFMYLSACTTVPIKFD